MSNATGTKKALSVKEAKSVNSSDKVQEVNVLQFNLIQRENNFKNEQAEEKITEDQSENTIIDELDSAADNMKSLSFDNLIHIIKDIRRPRVAR